jgi:uncharacterized protein DUF4145
VKIKKITKAPCRNCHRETKHILRAAREIPGEDGIEGVGEISWQDDYEMLECLGCESVVLRHTYYWSEDPEPTITYYPPPVSRPTPLWKSKLPYKIGSLLEEVYSALHANSRSLALMGARTLVDMAIFDKVGDAGNFQRKLEQMEQHGFLARENRQFLAAALEAGNAAAHRGYQPKEEHLAHVMDIVENLLQAVYVLKGAAAELRKATPPRPRKKQTP